MDIECPLCNGLVMIREDCPICAMKLEDWGPVQDYLEPYAPYLQKEMVQGVEDPPDCIHIFKCPRCSYDTRIPVKHIKI